MVEYLSRKEIQITVVSFQVFQSEPRGQILVREMTESETDNLKDLKPPRMTVENLLEKTAENGIGVKFREAYETAIRHGLRLRPLKASIMYAPQGNARRCLFTYWTQPYRGGKALPLGCFKCVRGVFCNSRGKDQGNLRRRRGAVFH